MKPEAKWEIQYKSALKEYVASPGEAGLGRAYELGRAALAEGQGLLDSAVRHQTAVTGILEDEAVKKNEEQSLEAAAAFFAEYLSPFEMALRGFQEANATLRRMNDTLEQETRRIAHALHDDAGQLLISVRIALAEISSAAEPVVRHHLNEVTGLLDQVEEHLRRFSHELRPTMLDDLGLVPAVEFLIQGVSKRSGLHVAVQSTLTRRLPPPFETALYRVVQEALTNITKHARATHATVLLERDGILLRCLIEDNGIGFDVPGILGSLGPKGLGLLGIRERVNAIGGSIRIDSGPGRGTKLHIMVRLED
jgi:two-component system sensor histidine kinase UhpB